ncbi:hypothetical protein FB451DRAFT_1185890 [Mycena latifolia]|nr:hypothetical protein FB451DRAFT_1185890 [Mycena latifolia]
MLNTFISGPLLFLVLAQGAVAALVPVKYVSCLRRKLPLMPIKRNVIPLGVEELYGFSYNYNHSIYRISRDIHLESTTVAPMASGAQKVPESRCIIRPFHYLPTYQMDRARKRKAQIWFTSCRESVRGQNTHQARK